MASKELQVKDRIDSNIKNDTVDIYSNPKVKITKNKTKKDNELDIILEGSAIDYSVANAIRRAVLLYVPVYGFNRSNIKIEQKKTNYMYNNDLIYNQIETMPIYDIDSGLDVVNPEMFMTSEIMKNLFGHLLPDNDNVFTDTELPDDMADKKLHKIEIHINMKNNTDENKFVNTHDIIYKIDGKNSDSYKKHEPVCLYVLKPNEETSLSAVANLGNPLMHAAYESTTNAVSLELASDKFQIKYESLGQIPPYVILSKACKILMMKLSALKKYIEKMSTEEKTESIGSEITRINLFGEDHTLGNLISTTMQKSDLIRSAGYIMTHPFKNEISIEFALEKKTKGQALKIFNDTLDYLYKLINNIEKSL